MLGAVLTIVRGMEGDTEGGRRPNILPPSVPRTGKSAARTMTQVPIQIRVPTY